LSQDFTVGTPFNIPQYVMLLNIIANIVDMDVEEFTWVLVSIFCIVLSEKTE
jgi:thymidylate synthase